MNIKRKIRLFFVSYGSFIFMCIGSALLFVFILQTIKDMMVTESKEEVQNHISQEEQLEIQMQENEEKEYITEFIKYCLENKIEEAYNMLSEKCKEEQYDTINKFREECINKNFNIKICDYKIEKEDDLYIVTLTEDMLITGRTDSTKTIQIKIDKLLETKIYIYN